jgi:hypothetical protein
MQQRFISRFVFYGEFITDDLLYRMRLRIQSSLLRYRLQYNKHRLVVTLYQPLRSDLFLVEDLRSLFYSVNISA